MKDQSRIKYSLLNAWAKLFYSCTMYDKNLIPSSGSAVLLGNTCSTLDFLWIQLTTSRRITFFIKLSEYPNWIHPLLAILHVRNFASHDILKLLQQDKLIGVFINDEAPEQAQMGSISSSAMSLLETISAETPLISFHIFGTYRSSFSKAFKQYLKKIPSNIRKVRGIAFAQIPHGLTRGEIKQHLFELSTKAFRALEGSMHSIASSWIDQAKIKPSEIVVEDPQAGKLTKRKIFILTLYLSRKLRKTSSRYVGILLPASLASTIFNMATLIAGKAVLNINFTAGKVAIHSALDQTKPDQIITSKEFIKRLEERNAMLPPLNPNQLIYAETIFKSLKQKKFTLLLYWLLTLLPAWSLKQIFCPKKNQLDDPAAILFSSGSEGTPKGVILTHGNILSNIEQSRDVLCNNNSDKMLACLPPFHAFGFTATLILPMLAGMPMVYYPDPMNVIAIASLIEQYKITIFPATPTFLGLYVRQKKVLPKQLQCLRFTVAGAEKLNAEIRDGFFQKFGIPIFEGYGVTETSPVVGVNIPDRKKPRSLSNPWHKDGTTGVPLPGIAIRIVDPKTMKKLPPNEDGLIVLGGAQVMQGYLNLPEKTEAAIYLDNEIRWYKTGDKGNLDDDGFLTIVDRYSRFAKIGGEMISLAAVEQSLYEVYTTFVNDKLANFPAVAVNIENTTKGEDIVILGEGADFLETLKQAVLKSSLSPLLRPSKYILIELIPILGSGKKDFTRAKELAKQLINTNNS